MTDSAEATPGLLKEVRVRGMRGAIAGGMMASLQNSAQLTLHREVNVGPLLELRRGLTEKLSINTLVMAAVARTLAARPDVNATLEEKVIRQWQVVHLGFAVALDDGLVVPVVRDAQRLTAGQLGAEIAGLTEKARQKVLSMEEITNGTFTVTNLGGFGIDYFTPILNLPQVAILGVGRVRGEAMTVSLTIDHRALDGAPGATFLSDLEAVLATPSALLTAA